MGHLLGFFLVIDHFDSQIENAQFLMEGSLLFAGGERGGEMTRTSHSEIRAGEEKIWGKDE